jgi:putative phosphoesterase
MVRIGILSDTHLTGVTPLFQQQVNGCFAGVDMILHAGDLTELSILTAFGNRPVHAVHGNMCGHAAYTALPERKIIRVGSFTIGLCHGAGATHDIEVWLRRELGPVDCIVYGHTHHAVCHRADSVLFINPGRFMTRGRLTDSGTYAILEVNNKLHARVYTIGGRDK